MRFILVAAAAILLGGAYAVAGPDHPHSDKSNPPGFDEGNKTGWDNGKPPGWDEGNKEGWEHKRPPGLESEKDDHDKH